jgi:hypothetical protein
MSPFDARNNSQNNNTKRFRAVSKVLFSVMNGPCTSAGIDGSVLQADGTTSVHGALQALSGVSIIGTQEEALLFGLRQAKADLEREPGLSIVDDGVATMFSLGSAANATELVNFLESRIVQQTRRICSALFDSRLTLKHVEQTCFEISHEAARSVPFMGSTRSLLAPSIDLGKSSALGRDSDAIGDWNVEPLTAKASAIVAEAYLQARDEALSAASETIAAAIMVSCSRTQSGGDAHAITHEVYGTGPPIGRDALASTGPLVRRNNVRPSIVLQHVQPSNWSKLRLAPSALGVCPLAIDLDSSSRDVTVSCSDLYQATNMDDGVEGVPLVLVQTVVKHSLCIERGVETLLDVENSIRHFLQRLSYLGITSAHIEHLSPSQLRVAAVKSLLRTHMPRIVDVQRVLNVQPVRKHPGDLRIFIERAVALPSGMPPPARVYGSKNKSAKKPKSPHMFTLDSVLKDAVVSAAKAYSFSVEEDVLSSLLVRLRHAGSGFYYASLKMALHLTGVSPGTFEADSRTSSALASALVLTSSSISLASALGMRVSIGSLNFDASSCVDLSYSSPSSGGVAVPRSRAVGLSIGGLSSAASRSSSPWTRSRGSIRSNSSMLVPRGNKSMMGGGLPADRLVFYTVPSPSQLYGAGNAGQPPSSLSSIASTVTSAQLPISPHRGYADTSESVYSAFLLANPVENNISSVKVMSDEGRNNNSNHFQSIDKSFASTPTFDETTAKANESQSLPGSVGGTQVAASGIIASAIVPDAVGVLGDHNHGRTRIIGYQQQSNNISIDTSAFGIDTTSSLPPHQQRDLPRNAMELPSPADLRSEPENAGATAYLVLYAGQGTSAGLETSRVPVQVEVVNGIFQARITSWKEGVIFRKWDGTSSLWISLWICPRLLSNIFTPSRMRDPSGLTTGTPDATSDQTHEPVRRTMHTESSFASRTPPHWAPTSTTSFVSRYQSEAASVATRILTSPSVAGMSSFMSPRSVAASQTNGAMFSLSARDIFSHSGARAPYPGHVCLGTGIIPLISTTPGSCSRITVTLTTPVRLHFTGIEETSSAAAMAADSNFCRGAIGPSINLIVPTKLSDGSGSPKEPETVKKASVVSEDVDLPTAQVQLDLYHWLHETKVQMTARYQRRIDRRKIRKPADSDIHGSMSPIDTGTPTV